MYQWKDNLNTIKEIYPGQYQIILNFATVKFLKYLLNSTCQYVWVLDHRPLKSVDFEEHSLPIFENENLTVLARKLNFDFVMSTVEAISNLEKFGPGISLAQIKLLPKFYVDKSTMRERTFLDLLKMECDYLFHVDLPAATDYGRLISADRSFLQRLLENPAINWSDLP